MNDLFDFIQIKVVVDGKNETNLSLRGNNKTQNKAKQRDYMGNNILTKLRNSFELIHFRWERG